MEENIHEAWCNGKIEVSTDNGRLAIISLPMGDGSKVYNVWVRGVVLPCNDGTSASNVYEFLAKNMAEGKIL